MTCVHRWRLSEPNGPLCDAVCRACGAQRQMPNYEPLNADRVLGMVGAENAARARQGWAARKAKEKANK